MTRWLALLAASLALIIGGLAYGLGWLLAKTEWR